jgi:hypothetical protein
VAVSMTFAADQVEAATAEFLRYLDGDPCPDAALDRSYHLVADLYSELVTLLVRFEHLASSEQLTELDRLESLDGRARLVIQIDRRRGVRSRSFSFRRAWRGASAAVGLGGPPRNAPGLDSDSGSDSWW